MPVATPPSSRPALRRMILNPHLAAARLSPAVRKWCDDHGYITPHFSWESYRCHDKARTQVPASLRANAIRFHWDLEALRQKLGGVSITVDGPWRTAAQNAAVGGSSQSRHMFADAGDFFAAQVDRWVAASRAVDSREDVLAICDQVFRLGGVGNETSGTLHLDSRGYKSRFVSWVPTRRR